MSVDLELLNQSGHLTTWYMKRTGRHPIDDAEALGVLEDRADAGGLSVSAIEALRLIAEYDPGALSCDHETWAYLMDDLDMRIDAAVTSVGIDQTDDNRDGGR